MGLPRPVEKNFFEEFGLEVSEGSVEVGRTYPIFGIITRLVDDTPGSVVVEINYNIRARMNVPDREKVEVLKERMFESGIFISTVMTKEPGIEVDCRLVIFGRRQAFNA